jgi:hypothetical protein
MHIACLIIKKGREKNIEYQAAGRERMWGENEKIGSDVQLLYASTATSKKLSYAWFMHFSPSAAFFWNWAAAGIDEYLWVISEHDCVFV